MNHVTNTDLPPSTGDAAPRKPYDQLPGEPDKWYRHFQRFCSLGPSRGVDHCYRAAVAERDGLPELPAPSTLRAPGSWKRKAR